MIDSEHSTYLDEKRIIELDVAIKSMRNRGFNTQGALSLLTEEEFDTQRKLATLPQHIEQLPYMDTLLLPHIPPNKENVTIIEFGGTILTGKTTHIVNGMRYAQPSYYTVLETVKYAKGVAPKLSFLDYFPFGRKKYEVLEVDRRLLRRDSSADFELMKLNLNSKLFVAIKEMLDKSIQQVPIVVDRGFVDQSIFAQARFMSGKLSLTGFLPFYNEGKNVGEFIAPIAQKCNYIFINCLTYPSVSISRAERQGDTVNVQFLETAFDQYRRAHVSIVTQHDRQFGYKCLDLSSGSISENQTKVDKTICRNIC